MNTKDMVLGTFLVYHEPASILFNSGALLYFIFSVFVTQHETPHENLNIKWNMNTENGSINSSKLCQSYPVVVCMRKASTY